MSIFTQHSKKIRVEHSEHPDRKFWIKTQKEIEFGIFDHFVFNLEENGQEYIVKIEKNSVNVITELSEYFKEFTTKKLIIFCNNKNILLNEFENCNESHKLSSFKTNVYKLKSDGDLFKQLAQTGDLFKEFLIQFRLVVVDNDPLEMDKRLKEKFSEISGENFDEKDETYKTVILKLLCTKWNTNPNRNCLELSHEDTSTIVHNLKYLQLDISSAHGHSYQVKILMQIYMKLFAETLRQKTANETITYKNFTVGSEKKEFDKFDDIVITYDDTDGKPSFHLIQVKHKLGEDKILLTKDFLKTNKHYNPLTYYKSYCEISKKNKKNYSSLAVLTNIMISCDLYSDLYESKEIIDDLFFNIRNVNEIINPEKVLRHRQPETSQYKRLEILKFKKTDKLYELVNENCTNGLLEEFFDKFRFIVGHPDEVQMDAVLKNQFKQISKLPMSEFIDEYLFKIFWDYYKEKGEIDPDLTYENMEEIILLIKIRANNFKIITEFHSLLKNIKYDENDETINIISDYFLTRISTDFLIIKTDFYILTLAKIFQCLDNETLKYKNSELLIIQFNSDAIQLEHIQMLENIRYFNFCAIIFHKNIKIEKQNEILSKVIRKITIKVIIIGPKDLDGDKNSLIDNVEFKNLTTDTKNCLIKRKIIFDGSEVVLEDLAGVNCLGNFSGSNWLSKLIQNQEFCTKKTTIEFNNLCYVERVVKLKNKFNQYQGYKIVPDYTGNTLFSEQFCYNENDFNKLKISKKDSNIHLLKKIPDDGVYWIKTHGNISYVHKIAEEYSYITEFDIINCDRKLNIFLSPEGMGKTTTLKSIYFKIKAQNPINNWIEFISLPKHVKVLKNIFKNINSIEFLLKYILNYDGITAEFFMNQTLVDKSLIFMFDSFDEIWPENKEFVINLINNLILLPSIKKIYLTSRPAYLSYFEHFTEFPLFLDYFSIEQQINYMINCFKINEIQLENLTKKSIHSCIEQLKNNKIELMIPFQAEMATEFLIEKYGEKLNFTRIEIDKFSFYKFCVKKKYDKYKVVKHKANMDDYSFQMEYNKSINRYDEYHQELACMEFEELATPEDFPEDDFIIINNIGMVMIAKCELVSFSHKAFANYFMAQRLWNVITG